MNDWLCIQIYNVEAQVYSPTMAAEKALKGLLGAVINFLDYVLFLLHIISEILCQRVVFFFYYIHFLKARLSQDRSAPLLKIGGFWVLEVGPVCPIFL